MEVLRQCTIRLIIQCMWARQSQYRFTTTLNFSLHPNFYLATMALNMGLLEMFIPSLAASGGVFNSSALVPEWNVNTKGIRVNTKEHKEVILEGISKSIYSPMSCLLLRTTPRLACATRGFYFVVFDDTLITQSVNRNASRWFCYQSLVANEKQITARFRFTQTRGRTEFTLISRCLKLNLIQLLNLSS